MSVTVFRIFQRVYRLRIVGHNNLRSWLMEFSQILSRTRPGPVVLAHDGMFAHPSGQPGMYH